MTTMALKWTMVAGLMAGFGGVAAAQTPDAGRAEFQSSCATCHGVDGRGGGPVAAQLKTPPPDLTTLSRRNGGAFPRDAVYDSVAGSKAVAAHGPREMPVWGERFNPVVRLPHYVDPEYWKLAGPEQNPDVVVRKRINSIVDHLERVQQK